MTCAKEYPSRLHQKPMDNEPKDSAVTAIPVEQGITPTEIPVVVTETKTPHAGGRPTVMTLEVVQKLEEAFIEGLTDNQACFLANISRQTLFNYCKDNPEFFDRKEDLKDSVLIQARRNISKEISNPEKPNLTLSQWYLERKDREFKPKSDMTTDNQPIQPITGMVIAKDNGTPIQNP